MKTSFQLVGLDPKPFQALFDLTDDALSALDAVRVVAHESPGYPCRISLEHAAVGDELLLLPYVHQPAHSPYRSLGPIYVGRGAVQARPSAGVVPDYVSSRLISARAYDHEHRIVDATVCEGSRAADDIERFFVDPQVAYIHLHNAKRGCFSCSVVRA